MRQHSTADADQVVGAVDRDSGREACGGTRVTVEAALAELSRELRLASMNPNATTDEIASLCRRCDELLADMRRRADGPSEQQASPPAVASGKIQRAVTLCKAYILHHGPAFSPTLVALVDRKLKPTGFSAHELAAQLSRDPDLFFDSGQGWCSRFAIALNGGVQAPPGEEGKAARQEAVALVENWFAGPGHGPRVEGLAGYLAAARPSNPKRQEVVAEARRILEAHGGPMTRRALYDALVEGGLIFGGRDPKMVMTAMFRRSPGQIVRLNGYGFWLADRDYGPYRADKTASIATAAANHA